MGIELGVQARSLTTQAIKKLLLFRLRYFEKLKSSESQMEPLPVRAFYITHV